jgi:adenylate cyclase
MKAALTRLWERIRRSAAMQLLWLLPIPLAWAAADAAGAFVYLENKLLDLRFRYRGPIDAPVKVVYVDLDTRALQLIGERPWDRGQFGVAARALLEAGGAKAVAFDLVFSQVSHSSLVDEPRARAGNLALARVVRDHPRAVVLGAHYTQGQAYTQEGAMRQFPFLRLGFDDRTRNDLPEMPQDPLIRPAWGRVGLIDYDPAYGGDEVPRWVPLFAHTLGPTLYHMALELALIDLGLGPDAVRIDDDRLQAVDEAGRVLLDVPLTERQLLQANWFSPWLDPRRNPRQSLADVLLFAAELAGDEEETRVAAGRWFEQFRDALVLIGPVDPLLQDLAPTPFEAQPMPKVGLHGNLVKTLRTGLYLREWRGWWPSLLTFLLTVPVTFLWLVGDVRGLRAKLTAVLLLLTYVWLGLSLFRDLHWVLPMTAPLGSALSGSFVALIWQVVREEKQKSRIKGMFGTYLAPQVVEQMIESGRDPELGGHDAEITAYFSDIQSFSSFSEVLSSSQLGELLNEYLTACTDIVQGEGGSLDKYIGDAVVAMFGAPLPAPDHAYRACRATLLVQERLGELRAKWAAEGARWPDLVPRMRTRIGLNTGVCMIGNMGSRTRFNYTMMGDNVNLAARMESGAKSWGAFTMVTDATRAACLTHGGDRIVFRPLGRIVVKGRSQPVPIHEVVGWRDRLSREALDGLELFALGMERYLARDWTKARECFERAATLESLQPGRDVGVHANPSMVYQDIVRAMAAKPPPEDWDGTYVMTEK